MPVFLGACIVLAIRETLVSISRVMEKRRADGAIHLKTIIK
jgi:hypothetical protein